MTYTRERKKTGPRSEGGPGAGKRPNDKLGCTIRITYVAAPFGSFEEVVLLPRPASPARPTPEYHSSTDNDIFSKGDIGYFLVYFR